MQHTYPYIKNKPQPSQSVNKVNKNQQVHANLQPFNNRQYPYIPSSTNRYSGGGNYHIIEKKEPQHNYRFDTNQLSLIKRVKQQNEKLKNYEQKINQNTKRFIRMQDNIKQELIKNEEQKQKLITAFVQMKLAFYKLLEQNHQLSQKIRNKANNKSQVKVDSEIDKDSNNVDNIFNDNDFEKMKNVQSIRTTARQIVNNSGLDEMQIKKTQSDLTQEQRLSLQLNKRVQNSQKQQNCKQKMRKQQKQQKVQVKQQEKQQRKEQRKQQSKQQDFLIKRQQIKQQQQQRQQQIKENKIIMRDNPQQSIELSNKEQGDNNNNEGDNSDDKQIDNKDINDGEVLTRVVEYKDNKGNVQTIQILTKKTTSRLVGQARTNNNNIIYRVILIILLIIIGLGSILYYNNNDKQFNNNNNDMLIQDKQQQ